MRLKKLARGQEVAIFRQLQISDSKISVKKYQGLSLFSFTSYIHQIILIFARHLVPFHFLSSLSIFHCSETASQSTAIHLPVQLIVMEVCLMSGSAVMHCILHMLHAATEITSNGDERKDAETKSGDQQDWFESLPSLCYILPRSLESASELVYPECHRQPVVTLL